MGEWGLWGLHTGSDDGDRYSLPAIWSDYQDWWGNDSPDYPAHDSVQRWGNIEEYLRDRHGLEPTPLDGEDRQQYLDEYFGHPATLSAAKLHSLAQSRPQIDGYHNPDDSTLLLNDDDLLSGAALGLLKIRRNEKANRWEPDEINPGYRYPPSGQHTSSIHDSRIGLRHNDSRHVKMHTTSRTATSDSYSSEDQVDGSAVINGVRRLADFAHRTHPGAAAFLGMTPDEQFDHFNNHLAPLYEQTGLPIPGSGKWLDFTDAVKDHWRNTQHTARLAAVNQPYQIGKDPHNRHVWLAHDGDTEAGRLSVEPDPDGNWIADLRVHPDHQRRGVGRALWEAAGRPAHTPDTWTPEGEAFARSVGGDFVLDDGLRGKFPHTSSRRQASSTEDQARLNDIAQKRQQMQRDYESRQAQDTQDQARKTLAQWHIAMAWQDWAPQIHQWESNDEKYPGGTYYIEHHDLPENPLTGVAQSHLDYDYTKPGEVNVSMLYSHPDHRNDGMAEALMRRLSDDHPGYKINPGMMTSQGQDFHDHMLQKEPSAKDLVTAAISTIRFAETISPRKFNPVPTTNARPGLDWQTVEPEQPMLDKSMPKAQRTRLNRGFPLSLNPQDWDSDEDAEAVGKLSRMIGSGQIQHPHFAQVLGDILGRRGLGTHFSTGEVMPLRYCETGDEPELPVSVSCDWAGLGEDSDRTDTGHWPDEQEVTLLPGAQSLSNFSVRVRNPQTRKWEEVHHPEGFSFTARLEEIARNAVRKNAMPAPLPEGVTFHHHTDYTDMGRAFHDRMLDKEPAAKDLVTAAIRLLEEIS